MILPALLFLSATFTDPVTGRTLTEVSTEGKSSNLYFHNSNFTADGKYLIYANDRTGTSQIYRYNLETGESRALTEAAGVAAASAMPDRFQARRVLYPKGRELWAVDVETGQSTRIGAAPERARGLGQPSVSHDGKAAAVSFQSGEKSWEIGLIDLATGSYRKVLEQGFRIGHVQHSPTAPLLFYVWETSGYAPQRTWLVNADGSGNRPFYAAIEPSKWLTPLKEWITHEAWVPGTGDMTMILDKYGILLVTPDGPAKVVARGHYWHAQATRDAKQLIADDFEGRVWLIEAATGEAKLIATGLRRAGEPHIHPSIDPDGKWVAVNAGRKGRPSVAVIQLRP